MGHSWGVKHRGACTTCSGTRKGGKGLWSILLRKGVYIIQKLSEKNRVSSIFSGYEIVCYYNLILLKFSGRL